MGYWEEIVSCEGGELLSQVVQRGCGCPIHGSVEGPVTQGLERRGPVRGALARVEGGFQGTVFA